MNSSIAREEQAPGQTQIANQLPEAGTDYLMKGTPGSRGYACGRALPVNGLAGNTPRGRGNVLVVRFPVPALATLLNQAEALLCAYGSPQALLVELAQQFGIPAVVDLGEAIAGIREGDRLFVDGGVGIVSTFDQRGVWQVNVSGLLRVPVVKDTEPLRLAA